MKCGFSFCGIDITTIGLEYAPELEDTYVYRSSKPRIHEETYDGHDGGFFYGMSREPKEFVLRCYFEEKEIDQGIMAQIMSLFREGRSGKLIFSRRPWCWYYATVIELDTTGITNYLNGIIKITMRSYYPFARSEMLIVNRNHKDYYRLMTNSAFFEHKEMIPPTEFCTQEPMTSETEFLLANPGNEYAAVGIEIAGDVGDGVKIINHTTEETASFVAMSEAEFDGEENYIYLDGLNGKTVSIKGDQKTNGFLYHNEGFITLAPGFPCRRDIQAVISNHELVVFNKLYDRNRGETRELTEEQIKGQYIWLNGTWHEILGVGHEFEWDDEKDRNENFREKQKLSFENEHRLVVDDDLPLVSTPEDTMICQLNHIEVKPVSDMKLTRLKFIYYPTFS